MMGKPMAAEASLLFPSLSSTGSTLSSSSILTPTLRTTTTTPASTQRPRTTNPITATSRPSQDYSKPTAVRSLLADAPAGFTEHTTSPSRAGLQAPTTLLAAMTAALLLPMAEAHDHHGEEKFPDGMTTNGEPIDTILWIHIFIQMLAYGIIFPVGMVLGMVRSRFHVPLQIVGSLLALLGALLGHSHKGREFVGHNVHAVFATPLQFLLLTQIALGLYLKMHLERGINGKIRPVIRVAHGVVGKAMPVLAWTQMLFGGMTVLGFCQGEHVGQCVAHFIMGSAFMAYAAIMTILLLVGQAWLRRTGRSQEFFDSAVIAAWGCVNTFTEHRWGTAWVKNDWQHTTMGIIWWCAGLAGIWLSKDREGRPKRNFVPGVVLIMTGWGMSGHPQELMVSEAVHKIFGYSLMAAGLSRIIEVSFVCKDGYEPPNGEINSFQYIPIYFLFASGFLFMGATEEQMDLVANSGMDHVSYILILYSLAFVLFLFVNILVSGYDRAMNPIAPARGPQRIPGRHNRISMSQGEERQLREAEEFALDDLMSDDDEEAGLVRARRKEEELERNSDDQRRGLGSPSSTLGGNNERVAR